MRFYVHPEHHGSGTARLLMEHTLSAATATGARGAWLGVSEENARANAFYIAWDAIARDRDSFLAWMDEHVMKGSPADFAPHARRAA